MPNVPHRLLSLARTPFGRLLWTRDKGDSLMEGRMAFQSHLAAKVIRANGKIEERDLGSGLTTQSLAIALSQQGVSANNTGNTLGLLKYMQSGTGATAAAAYDYALQTLTTTTTQTGGFTTAITPTYGFSADNATMQFVGTLNYTGTLAITEWGLFASNATPLSGFTNTSTDTFTGTSATPGASQSWTAHAYAGIGVCQVASATSVIGFVTDNSATALTVSGWANQTSGGGAGSTPSSNTAMTLVPLMADHKVFAAVNVNSGDSIQFTYTLTINSGG